MPLQLCYNYATQDNQDIEDFTDFADFMNQDFIDFMNQGYNYRMETLVPLRFDGLHVQTIYTTLNSIHV